MKLSELMFCTPPLEMIVSAIIREGFSTGLDMKLVVGALDQLMKGMYMKQSAFLQ